MFDLCDNTRLAFIQQNAPADVACQPSLAWHAPDTLVTAWHNVIHVLQVRIAPESQLLTTPDVRVRFARASAPFSAGSSSTSS